MRWLNIGVIALSGAMAIWLGEVAAGQGSTHISMNQEADRQMTAVFVASGKPAAGSALTAFSPFLSVDDGELLRLSDILRPDVTPSEPTPQFVKAQLVLLITNANGEVLATDRVAECERLNLFDEVDADIPPRAECDSNYYALEVARGHINVTKAGKGIREFTLDAGTHSLNGFPFKVPASP